MRRWIIGALILLLAGCSTLRIGYGQGPMLAAWWLDRYADFDDGQSRRVRAALDELFRWHRGAPLADLVQWMAQVRGEVAGPITAERMCRLNDEGSQRLMAVWEHALPAIAEIAPTLQPAQLQHIAQRQAKGNEDFRDDFLQDDPAERRRESIKRARERTEMVYGRLDEAQRALLARGVAASPFDPVAWEAERLARQGEINALLRRWTTEKVPPEQIRAELKALGEHALRSPREPYRSYQRRLVDYNCAFAADLHNAMTPKQRQHAADKLKGWEDDLRSFLTK
ncbi:DUF6279 family lipoprotein [Piscinibacter sakaiensis]|uniref:Lipoprotein, putative n=1 Tax=Piscinibacter sakaiensis TaxID=1547922 RepID=A0A0K8P6C5_PISS1|nr:DUF6279 family lipoprotein [Piscinibacter sakaiensis]GAP37750.1 lipoprotein, putative [Piscinibacter sakaiensis]